MAMAKPSYTRYQKKKHYTHANKVYKRSRVDPRHMSSVRRPIVHAERDHLFYSEVYILIFVFYRSYIVYNTPYRQSRIRYRIIISRTGYIKHYNNCLGSRTLHNQKEQQVNSKIHKQANELKTTCPKYHNTQNTT